MAGTPAPPSVTPDAAATLPAATAVAPSHEAGDGRHYLLVFEGDSSQLFDLPRSGEIVVGRGDGADLQLAEAGVSRRHVKLVLDGADARLVDLGSQNGTHINGGRCTGERPLASGDVIAIGGVTLVFHASGRFARARAPVSTVELRARAEEEIDRALRYHRSLALFVVALGEDVVDRPRVAHALARHMRLIDLAAWGAGEELWLLVPEADREGTAETARRLLAVLAPVTPKARVGFAVCPHDGCDVDTLLASARGAARAEAPGPVHAAADDFRTFEVGAQRVVAAEPAVLRLYALVERLAASTLPVLIHGETGSGKELVSSALHHWSPRKAGPLVVVNCAAIPENLLESELFGHERGAFSGALTQKPGLFETASGGTAVLDEVGELPLSLQAKLLRVLETGQLTRLGDVKPRAIDIRVVAATNRDLAEECRQGRFRQDLFFRLSGATLWLPPLRDRQRELLVLGRRFLGEACERHNRAPLELSDGAIQLLSRHGWPGNVRELRHVIDYLAATVPGDLVEPWHLAERLGGSPQSPAPADATLVAAGGAPRFRPIGEEIRELERDRMVAALQATDGNQTRAAELIAMPVRTFFTKIKEYNLRALMRRE